MDHLDVRLPHDIQGLILISCKLAACTSLQCTCVSHQSLPDPFTLRTHDYQRLELDDGRSSRRDSHKASMSEICSPRELCVASGKTTLVRWLNSIMEVNAELINMSASWFTYFHITMQPYIYLQTCVGVTQPSSFFSLHPCKAFR